MHEDRFMDLTPTEGGEILLDQQFWQPRDSGSKVRLDVDTEMTDDRYKLDLSALQLPTFMTEDEPTIERMREMLDELFDDQQEHSNEQKQMLCIRRHKPITFFDGINSKRSALVGTIVASSLPGQTKSIFFLLKQSFKGSGTTKHNDTEKEKPFLCINGFLQSVLLHPDCNRIMYSVLHEGQQGSDQPENKYVLNVADISDDNSCMPVASQLLGVSITKAIFIGKDTYLARTDTGKLATIWLEDKKIQYAVHTGASAIKDIAVDNSYQTATGFKPRIAYVNNAGDVFVTDLKEFKKPTMLFNTKLEKPEKIFRLFYDKGQLAVLYRDDEGFFGDFIVWQDNLGPLYLKTVLAQKLRTQQNALKS